MYIPLTTYCCHQSLYNSYQDIMVTDSYFEAPAILQLFLCSLDSAVSIFARRSATDILTQQEFLQNRQHYI